MDNLKIYYKVEEPFEKNEDNYLVLSDSKGEIVTLNEISFFIWNNCEKKNIDEVVDTLIAACVNGAELDVDMIRNDCQMALSEMVKKGLILERDV